MAVLTSDPGVKVEIVVGGRPLREYVDTKAENSAKQTTQYIEVENEGPFEIHAQVSGDYVQKHPVCMEVHLDGVMVARCYVPKYNATNEGKYQYTGYKTNIAERWHTSDLCFSSFAFGK